MISGGIKRDHWKILGYESINDLIQAMDAISSHDNVYNYMDSNINIYWNSV